MFNAGLSVPVSSTTILMSPSMIMSSLDFAILGENLRRFSPKIAKSKDDIIMDGDIRIVVELTGTDNPALNIITQANHYQKDVVTANKLTLAKHWADIFDNAEQCQREVRYEACVG